MVHRRQTVSGHLSDPTVPAPSCRPGRQQTDALRPSCVRRLKGEFCIMRADSVAAILRVNRGWPRRCGDAGAATPYAVRW